MWLISGMNGSGFNIGDFYAILCSVTYSGYIMAMNKITHNHPTYTLTVLQLVWVSILSFIGISFFEDFTPQVFVTGLIPILTIGLLGTALATLTQTYAQQKVSAEAVSIILLGEPLFTLIMAVIILNEPTTLQGLTGGALLLVSMYTTVHKKL
jgi:drug/metabolite transporter (DMT)-like permease